MLKTNKNKLIVQSVVGQITNPTFSRTPYVISAEGKPVVLPSVGGITYNVRIGDKACGWACDHVEPSVSISNMEKSIGSWSPNAGLNTLSCIGNEVKVISGDAKGDKGVVIGKHGGIEHVIVDFSKKTIEKLSVGDKMQVKSYGTGLVLEGFYPDVNVMNMSPDLLAKINVKITNNTFSFPVTHIVPAAIMGSGIGASHVYSGDYDIQLFDSDYVKKYKLASLRFGDFVAIADADHTFGRIFKTGSVSIGVIVHSDCVIAGHGPGVTTIMTSRSGNIKPVIDKNSNLVKYLKIKSKSR